MCLLSLHSWQAFHGNLAPSWSARKVMLVGATSAGSLEGKNYCSWLWHENETAVAARRLATWSSSLHGVVASMAEKMGMQKSGLSVHEPRKNAHVAVHAREKDVPFV